MKVTFIFHSSFAVELKESVLVFDYYGEGQLPKFPQNKRIYFLASHGHGDHYNKKILAYRNEYPQAEYILSRDIRLKPEEGKPWIHSVKGNEEYSFGPLTVKTLKSTDLGVAYMAETEHIRIYHAGDLNWWHWEEEDKAWNNNMAANYKREMDKLSGEHVHLAFVVLDPRLCGAWDWGMDYYLSRTDNDHVFPMHCWEQYEVCRRYEKKLEDQAGAGKAICFHKLEHPGQEWELSEK